MASHQDYPSCWGLRSQGEGLQLPSPHLNRSSSSGRSTRSSAVSCAPFSSVSLMMLSRSSCVCKAFYIYLQGDAIVCEKCAFDSWLAKWDGPRFLVRDKLICSNYSGTKLKWYVCESIDFVTNKGQQSIVIITFFKLINLNYMIQEAESG